MDATPNGPQEISQPQNIEENAKMEVIDDQFVDNQLVMEENSGVAAVAANTAAEVPAIVEAASKAPAAVLETETNSEHPQAAANVEQVLDPALEEFLKPKTPEVMQVVPPVPLSEYDQLREAVKNDQYSSAKWNRLVEFSERSNDITKIKETYDWLLQIYPNTIAYLRHFTDVMEREYQEAAQNLFKPFLRQSSSPDLYRFYLSYVSRVNTGRANYQETMRRSYEFALGQCGHDKDSGIMWAEFIEFIKSWDTADANASAMRINELRKWYKKAVQIPLENVEQLWRDYGEWESVMNKAGARAMLATVSQAHMTAKTKLRELREFLKLVMPPEPAVIPGQTPKFDLPVPPTFSITEKSYRDQWLRYLQWEEGNQLEFELASDTGRKEYITRVRGVYRRASVRMRFYGEVWFRWYTWTKSQDKHPDDSLSILVQGVEAEPCSHLLSWALAEQYELQNKYEEVHKVYTSLVDKCGDELDKIEAAIPAETTKTEENPATEAVNGAAVNGSEKQTPKEDSVRTLLKLRIKETGQAWIMYIRFARRAEGFQSARKVFGRARKARLLDWRVYDFAATTEYHCTKATDVATKIYETGLKRYADDVDFIVHYLNFLININDENNARALFERTITTFPSDKAKPLWERWLAYEYNFTDLQASLTLEKRLAEAYPEDPPTKRFAMRHKFYADAIATKDRGFITPESSAAQILVRGGDAAEAAKQSGSVNQSQAPAAKRAASPTPSERGKPPEREKERDKEKERDRRRRDDSPARRHDGPPHKRSRGMSPPARDRDRYDMAPPRRRGSPAGRDRDRDDAPSRRYGGERDENRDRPPASSVPSLISWFMSTLPNAQAFDGPVFRTEDLMNVLKNAVIPNSPPRIRSPPTSRTRPAPDYGPYRGPGSSAVTSTRRW